MAKTTTILGMCLIFIAIAILVQVSMNAWTADFAGADEAAHYVTGVMVRTYLTSINWFDPLRFAEEYYEAYPKVAIGHWPPLFYAVEGIWMVIFSPSRESMMVFLAMLAAGCGAATFLFWRDAVGRWLAGGVAVLALFIPIVRWAYSTVASELLVVLFILLAGRVYAEYLSTEQSLYSMAFGFLAAAAIMTKANGLALAFVPPVAVLLTRKLHLLRRVSFWWPVPIVIVSCVPWYWLTLNMAQEGWHASANPRFILQTVAAANAESLYRNLGIAVLALAAIGVWQSVVRPLWRGQPVEPVWSVSFAIVVAGYMFHSFVVPVRGGRHLIPVMLSLAAFGASGARASATFIAGKWSTGGLPTTQRLRQYASLSICVLTILQFAWQTARVIRKPNIGAVTVAEWLVAPAAARSNALVTAPIAEGEGAIIAETAMRSPQPQRRIHRASKVFADVLWSGEVYRQKFQTPQQVFDKLSDMQVRYIIVDRLEIKSHMEHHKRLAKLVRSMPERFRLIDLPATHARFDIYEFASHSSRR